MSGQLSFSTGLCGLFAPRSAPLSSTTPTIEFFCFEYEAGNPHFIDDVLGHAPEVCMSASGATLENIHPNRVFQIGEQTTSIRVLEFTPALSEQPIWVFRLTWLPADSPYQPSSDGAALRKERILGALLGNPRPPATVVLAGARNFPDEASAWEAFRSLVLSRLELSREVQLAKTD
ncbi:MAG: hypothetical protein AAGC68_06490 [Verrucomicrobiota bacterium]